MARTDLAPSPTATDITDGLVHLVCGCQLIGRSIPRFPLITAMCGMGDEAGNYMPHAEKWCPMCVDEADHGLCPACGDRGHA